MNIENSSIPSIRFAAFSMMLLMLINPISMGEVFPSDPFNGLQVSYTISGATLDTPEDAEGFTFLRSIKGVLESDELTVSGVAKATNGWGATIDVSVGVDGEEPKTFHEEKFPEEGLMPDPMSQPFTVTVPIPAEAESASFSISLSGSYNAGSRGVVVEGTLDRSNSSSSSQNGKTYCCAGSCSHKKWWSESGSSQDSGEKLRIMADSGVRFSGLTGQVDIRPDGDEDAWRGAGLKSIINQNDHIRTGEESRAILSFPDMTTFDLRPESEVIVDTPAEKDSKVSLVCGKIWTNFKKMLKDGTMEVQMSQAVAGIKGTTIVCEETGDSSALKVLDGKASFKSKATGEEILVRAGEMVTATESGLSKIQSFDVEAENASFGPYAPAIEAVESKESRVIYNSWNLGFVDDAPTCSPFFTINEPQMITYIDTYHRNLGQGAPGGTIGLRGGDGTLYGPWEAATSLDQGDMDKGYWIVHPNEVIPSGTYTIEDSDPETWSKNSESPCGFAKVEGYPVESSAFQERGVPVAGTKETGSSAAPPKTGSSYSATGIADSAIQSSQERGSVAQEEIADAGTNSYTADKATSSPAKEDLAAGWPESVLMGESAYVDASAQSIKIRGQVATGNFKWTAQNFAGFYYDPKNDMGTEVLTATLMDGRLSGSHPFGLYYQTTAQRQDFDFQEWGSYLVLGFLGEKHFAGYLGGSDSENGYLFDQSGDKSILAKGQLLEILADDDDRDFFTATTITTNTPLQLKEGYELSIKSIDIDGNVVDLELTRDGSAVDSAKVSPSRDGATIADQTYLYKKDIGELKDVVVIAVHFKNAFRGADSDLATVDGIWQLSENPIKVSSGTKYEKMVVSSVTDNAVIMNNQGSDIALSRNKEIPIMPGIIIRTADADELRYCVFRELTKPGTYELRGSVAIDSNAWNAQNFSGFYYDIDGDIQTEELTATITSGNFVEPGGLTYSTGTLADDFEFEDWGSYEVMGFLGEKCFAGYIEGSDSGEGYLFEKSTIKNALAEGQIMKVLADDDTERTITSNTSLMLAENFSLELKAVNPNDGKVLIELHRDDHLVANWIIQPSKEDAGISDQTIFYRNPQVGSQKNLVTIAVHFKDAFKGADQDLATVDGVWQISEFPISVAEGTAFDRLVISNVMPDQILMENMNGPITLSGNKDMTLAGDISIKTADSDSLRYYIHRDVEITELTTSPTDLFTGITRKSVTTLEKPVLPGAQNLDESSGKVAETGDPVQRLKALKELMDAGLITEEEYADRKAEILATV